MRLRSIGRAVLVGTLTAVVVGMAGPASAGVSGNGPVGSGSLLVDETFTGASVDDPELRALGDACLTAATAPATGTGPGSCTSTTPAADGRGGWLQLTPAVDFRSGAVLANRPLPAGNGLVVQFDQLQYGGSGGGDGIGFFLVDGDTEVTAPGSNGSGLGYAQRTYGGVQYPGVAGGYLGVGVDAVGSFAVDDEGKGAGCSTPSPVASRMPSSVSVRGPGDGMTGYCYLASAAIGAPGVRGSSPADAVRTIRVTVSPEALPLVTVAVDQHDGTGLHTVLSVRTTQAPPPTYRFGLAASTGTFNDVHLVRDLRVSSVDPLGDPDLLGQVVSTPADGNAYTAGETIRTRYVVTNTAPAAVSGVGVALSSPRGAAADPVTCPRTTLGVAGSGTASMVCTAGHVVTADDLAHGPAWRTTATASASSGGGAPTRASAPVELSAVVVVGPPVPPGSTGTTGTTSATGTTAPVAPPVPQLAATGATPGPALLAAGLMLGAGAVLLGAGRRSEGASRLRPGSRTGP
ncbi:hypothetical protein SAMN05660199_00858 [Klenkia soli]|uniref:LPXTG-motif cell wall anchor domain-containing protein n=1 Tax=Klenkia soli TaxID=1052260 RepID=A0A1H0ETB5_9ACTN|nr:hypothetical protein [Klenkia soli]SDN85618.1 hypothetical protein SAMN05660199_00858 [Klenkia soli]